MGVNIFVPCEATANLEAINGTAMEKAKGRFDWCKPFEGPGGALLTLNDALAFDDDSAPYWVLTGGKMHTIKNRAQWQHLLKASGASHVCFLKARG